MTAKEITIELVCIDLPGIRFEDTYCNPVIVREPVYLGTPKGREAIEAVPVDLWKTDKKAGRDAYR